MCYVGLYLSSTHMGFVVRFRLKLEYVYVWMGRIWTVRPGSSWPPSNPLRCFTGPILRRLPWIGTRGPFVSRPWRNLSGILYWLSQLSLALCNRQRNSAGLMNSFTRRCRMMGTAFCVQIIGLLGEWKTNKCINHSMYWYSLISYMFRHFKMPSSGSQTWSCWYRCPLSWEAE
jgi:hypothetical protein